MTIISSFSINNQFILNQDIEINQFIFNKDIEIETGQDQLTKKEIIKTILKNGVFELKKIVTNIAFLKYFFQKENQILNNKFTTILLEWCKNKSLEEEFIKELSNSFLTKEEKGYEVLNKIINFEIIDFEILLIFQILTNIILIDECFEKETPNKAVENILIIKNKEEEKILNEKFKECFEEGKKTLNNKLITILLDSKEKNKVLKKIGNFLNNESLTELSEEEKNEFLKKITNFLNNEFIINLLEKNKEQFFLTVNILKTLYFQCNLIFNLLNNNIHNLCNKQQLTVDKLKNNILLESEKKSKKEKTLEIILQLIKNINFLSYKKPKKLKKILLTLYYNNIFSLKYDKKNEIFIFKNKFNKTIIKIKTIDNNFTNKEKKELKNILKIFIRFLLEILLLKILEEYEKNFKNSKKDKVFPLIGSLYIQKLNGLFFIVQNETKAEINNPQDNNPVSSFLKENFKKFFRVKESGLFFIKTKEKIISLFAFKDILNIILLEKNLNNIKIQNFLYHMIRLLFEKKI